jgi:hypothetical protein
MSHPPVPVAGRAALAAASSGSRETPVCRPSGYTIFRHGAATLALAGGADLKTVSEMLGHSTITITADTYASVLPEVARSAAEAAARLVPRGALVIHAVQSLRWGHRRTEPAITERRDPGWRQAEPPLRGIR